MLGLESKYAYATGRVRVLETRLLDRGRLDRMVEAPDLEGAVKVLAEAGYASAQLSEKAHPSIDDILAGEEERLVILVRETTPEPQLVDFITARWDYHNVKVMLKARLHRVPPEKAIARHGTVDVAAIERAIDGDVRDLEPHLALALEAAKAAHARRPSPDSIDVAVDREMYRYLLTKARGLRIPFLIEVIQREIDFFNVAAFFRARRMGRDKAFLAEALVQGGKISTSLLTTEYEQPPEAVLQGLLSGTGYEALVRDALGAVGQGKQLSELDRLFEAAMWEYIRKARYVPLGPEPLVGYIFAKMYELKLARLVLVGKTSGMSRDMMRGRLRDIHV